jgi:hypothetical protein
MHSGLSRIKDTTDCNRHHLHCLFLTFLINLYIIDRYFIDSKAFDLTKRLPIIMQQVFPIKHVFDFRHILLFHNFTNLWQDRGRDPVIEEWIIL